MLHFLILGVGFLNVVFFNFGSGFFLGFRCWVDYILDLCFLISDFGIWVWGFLSVLLDFGFFIFEHARVSGFALPKHLCCSEAKQVFSI